MFGRLLYRRHGSLPVFEILIESLSGIVLLRKDDEKR